LAGTSGWHIWPGYLVGIPKYLAGKSGWGIWPGYLAEIRKTWLEHLAGIARISGQNTEILGWNIWLEHLAKISGRDTKYFAGTSGWDI
jgi:hypothetical protein